jgi:hypothetical protein
MPLSAAQPLARGLDVGALRQVDRGEGAQRAVVHHVGIGDRQDHARDAGAQPAVEPVLQVDHVGRAVHAHLGVHAVVGRQRDHAAQASSSLQVAVHHA